MNNKERKQVIKNAAEHVLAYLIITAIVLWFIFLGRLGFGGTLTDGLNDVRNFLVILAFALICAGAMWLTEQKNVVLRVIGNVLCFIFFSAIFVGCCAWVSLLGS